MNLRSFRSIALLLLTTPGLACVPFDTRVSRPRELVGSWARWRSDTTWADTVELFPDGSVRGWGRATDRDSISWMLIHTRVGDALCVGSRRQPGCETYRLEGDTLVLGDMPRNSYWRRAH
jgi:hypothetical protein